MSILVIVISYIIQSIFVGSMGMDVVIYAVKVPICIIFGEFIMLLLMQTSPVQTVSQPGKGIILIIFSIILSVVMYHLYTWFSVHVTGGLPSGTSRVRTRTLDRYSPPELHVPCHRNLYRSLRVLAADRGEASEGVV